MRAGCARWIWALGLGLAACAPRATHEAGGASRARAGLAPPLLAWLEPPPGEGESLTVVVMPTRVLAGAIDVRVAGASAHSTRLNGRGGRVALRIARAEPVRVEVLWQEPSGAAGARAVLEHPARSVTAPVFVPIVDHRLGGHGPTIDRAIRIR